MLKNQKGFTHVVLLSCLVLALVFIGALTVSRLRNSSMATGQHVAAGQYVTKDFEVNFERKSDDNLASQYSLTVTYDDSFDPASPCPAQLAGFTGSLDAHYLSDSEVEIDVSQNTKPQTKRNDNGTAICTDQAVPAYTQSITLKKQWVENNDASKTLRVNDKTYRVTINKKTRVITFSGPNTSARTQPYLPDGLAQLYAYPMYKNCMTVEQLKEYAREHGIVAADSKYPGLTAQVQAIPKLKLEAPDGSSNILLVIANDYVKQLVKDTRTEKYTDVCHVVASEPVYTGVN